MNPAILNSQFVPVALPIVLTIFIAAWMNGRSIDGISKSIDGIASRFVSSPLKAASRTSANV